MLLAREVGQAEELVQTGEQHDVFMVVVVGLGRQEQHNERDK
jgi:hypothetical protein